MYPQDTYPPYPQDTYGTRLILKVCLSFYSFLLLFLDRIGMKDTWTKTNKKATPSSGNGRFPKRIGPSTRLNHGMENIAGFDPPMLCASSNTGIDCNLTEHSTVRARSSCLGLSRDHETGLICSLNGGEVVAVTEDTAAIRWPRGSITESNKATLGPLSDCLDDLT